MSGRIQIKMEIQLVIVLLVSCFSSVISHPKNSDIIPKGYYQRQILQPLPGYIPVYIKADGEPFVRREKVKQAPNVNSEYEKKNLPENSKKEVLTINEDKISEKISPKSVQKETKNSEERSKNLKKVDILNVKDLLANNKS